MILHALELTGRDLLLAFVPTLIFVALVYLVGRLECRAERHHLEAVEAEERRNLEQKVDHERRREEIRSFNARPTCEERWGGVA